MLSFTRHYVEPSAMVALTLVLLAGAACSSDSTFNFGGTSPPYDMMFSLDATFQAPHGGNPVEIALVRSTDGMLLAQDSGTISATQSPTFTFIANNIMERGVPYEVHYWIDSNIGGGTVGTCDAKDVDHQWSVEFLSPTNNVMWSASYTPALTEDVCGTFP